MMKKATRRQSMAVTFVVWDINLCPVPPDVDPRLVRPRIKRFLENWGYFGPLNIAAAGILTDVPIDILRGVFSSGISLTNVPYGSSDMEEVIDGLTYENPSPANIMVISDPNIFPCVPKYLKMSGFNPLQPCPFYSLPSLLRAGESEEETSSSSDEEETGASACWNCWLCCRDPPGHVFEDFIMHLYDEDHQQLMLDLLPKNDFVPRLPLPTVVPQFATLMTWDWFPPKNVRLTSDEAVTLVFWAINTCAVPRGFDPRLVGPCIKRYLRSKGYFGPLTIIAVGVLTDIPIDILRGVYSGGVALTNAPYGSSDIERLICEFADRYPPPANIVVISDAKIFPPISRYLQLRKYNLKCSGAHEKDKCSKTGEAAYWFCSVCNCGLANKGFDNFTTHLSSRQHQQKLLDVLPMDVGPSECHEKNQEAVTAVFWDINRCPVPPGVDPSLVLSCIKRFWENCGYSGPLTITAAGALTNVPIDILNGVYASGISLNSISDGFSNIEACVIYYTDRNKPPGNIMVISDPDPDSFRSISEYVQMKGYKFHEYRSIESFLPADPGALEEDKCSDTGESASWVC